MQNKTKPAAILAGLCALCGSLSLAWSDSVWFSAVEAEVYALSLMLTALTLWLMFKWYSIDGNDYKAESKRQRILILEAYLLGLSIGVHQLNLLIIPALCLIACYKLNNKKALLPALGWLLLGCVLIILLLKGMLPGTARLSTCFELFFVNTLGLPYFSGAYIYLFLSLTGIVGSLLVSTVSPTAFLSKSAKVLFLALLMFCSGIFMIWPNWIFTLCVSLILSLWFVFKHPLSKKKLILSIWMLAMATLGFSTYLLIPIRSSAMPPLNESQPADPFSYLSYINREQYGSSSLFMGPTPYSRPVLLEEFNQDSTPVYRRYQLEITSPVYVKNMKGLQPVNLSRQMEKKDSDEFYANRNKGKDAWQLVDWRFRTVNIPELNMLFSRMHGRQPDDIKSYQAWAGMDSSNMKEVYISDALDSLGNPVTKLSFDGKRTQPKALKPTQWQNLRFLLGYQVGYMYMRYLLWNFSGRQNDIPSTGEIEHGNFITGFPLIDNAMLGPQHLLPEDTGEKNPGHNVYYMLPLLLGILGAIWCAFQNQEMRRLDTVILIVFLLTGVAIVLYLNQNTGEARERDYSFLGSFMAFSIWISLGAAAVVCMAANILKKIFKSQQKKRFASYAIAVLTLGIPMMMLAENHDDHNRSRRTAAEDYAVNILNSLEKNAIIFVDGDNLTFPLWYAQETLGIRRDVRVISVTYLAQAGYWLQLMTPTAESPAVPFVAKPYQIASGRFSSVPFIEDTLQTADAVKTLERLYSSAGKNGRLEAGRLYFQPDATNSLYVDVKKSAAGATTLKRRQLAVLDIISANYALSNPRPVYFANSLPAQAYAGTFDMALYAPMARKLPSTQNKKEEQHSLDIQGLKLVADLKHGGFRLPNPPYTDFTVHRETSYQRAAILSLAQRLAEAGDLNSAYMLTLQSLKMFPPQYAPWRITGYGGKSFDELQTTVELLCLTSPDNQGKAKSVKLLRNEQKRAEQWQKYISALGNRRMATSRRTRALASRASQLSEKSDSISSLLK